MRMYALFDEMMQQYRVRKNSMTGTDLSYQTERVQETKISLHFILKSNICTWQTHTNTHAKKEHTHFMEKDLETVIFFFFCFLFSVSLNLLLSLLLLMFLLFKS